MIFSSSYKLKNYYKPTKMNFEPLTEKFKLTPIKTIIFCLLFLNLLSLTTIYSGLHQGSQLPDLSIFYKQIIWVIISWIILIIFSRVNYRFYLDITYLFYVLNLFLLLAVYLFGKKTMGAQRWLSISGFTFQPSELSKITAIFLLAKLFSSGENSFRKGFILPFFLIVVNALFIFKQPDLGTALVLVILFILVGFSSRVSKKYFVFLIIGGIMFFPFAMHFLKDYQKKRLIVFLNPNVDPLGAGYTIIQSKIAIGSGKLAGKGFLSGTQNQFNFLPERHTDFIFTIIAEEWGFLGSLFLLLIYWLIIRTIMAKIKESKDSFVKLMLAGIASFFFIHVFVNIGMTLGILPVVGIPLTFLSYGGTNLLVSFILIGIFINISVNTK